MVLTPLAGGSCGSQAQNAVVNSTEFVVRIARRDKRRFHVMKFLRGGEQKVSEWTEATMERENNRREFRTESDDLPKHGAGSEYGRDLKEEARRMKYGYVRKKYNPDNQPWLLNVGGEEGKKYKGVRNGGVTENTSYYIFAKSPDGIFEAIPIDHWYNFNPINRFKALTAEEAEDAFSKRDQIINHAAIMINKRLVEAQLTAAEPEKEEKTGNRARHQLTEMEDWVVDCDLSAGSNDENDAEDAKKKKKKRKIEKKKDEKDQESDSSAKEESDEGDFDVREVDYMTSGSDSSDGEPEDAKANKQLKGVEDEDALRQLFLSDEDEEEEEAKKDGVDEEKENGNNETGAASKNIASKNGKRKISKSSEESSSESSGSDLDDQIGKSALFMQGRKKDGNGIGPGTSAKEVAGKKSKTTTAKRKIEIAPSEEDPSQADPATNAGVSLVSKKAKMDFTLAGSASKTPTASSVQQSTPSTQVEGVSEEVIRRYLMRKPMTAAELLQKFKNKKTGLPSDQLVNVIAQTLKRINPTRQKIQDKLYFSIKK